MTGKEIVLGIDIGGTNTSFALVDWEGKCLSLRQIPTRADNPAEQLFKRVFTKVAEMEKEISRSYKLSGVGIGAPNGNYYRGTIEDPPNLSWGTVNLVELVKRYQNLPVVVTNDANAAALGEMKFGAAKSFRNFIQITLGTGLGSGIVVNGKLVYGHDGFAGEMGHVTVKENGRRCGCGRRGCLETYASATGICRTVFELLSDSNLPSTLRNVPYSQLTAKAIYEAAVSGDQIARQAFRFTGEVLGKALANAVAYLSPEAIVLFGGLATAGDLVFQPVQQFMENNLLNIYKGKVKIIPSALPSGEAAVLGAAALIWHELHSPNART
ncbi:MAG TPA: ROK family protein [Caldithrix sp.]|nr:ROK family protein [Caldithrix sp.]